MQWLGYSVRSAGDFSDGSDFNGTTEQFCHFRYHTDGHSCSHWSKCQYLTSKNDHTLSKNVSYACLTEEAVELPSVITPDWYQQNRVQILYHTHGNISEPAKQAPLTDTINDDFLRYIFRPRNSRLKYRQVTVGIGGRSLELQNNLTHWRADKN